MNISDLKSAIEEVKEGYTEIDSLLLSSIENEQGLKTAILYTLKTKSLLSIKGNCIEKLCGAYIVSRTEDSMSIIPLYLASGAMQIAKMKRKGILRTLSEDLSIGLIAAYLHYQKSKEGKQS